MPDRLAPLLLILASLCAAGCDQGAPPAQPPPPPAASPPREAAGSISDALAPGDTLRGLQVVAADLRPDPVDGFGWMGTARFSGAVRLTGGYRPHPDYPAADELCFYPDSASAERLPRLPNDRRTSWLCFSNQEAAQAELGPMPAAGTAVVEVDSFDYIYQHTDVYNRASLLRVLEGEGSEEPG